MFLIFGQNMSTVCILLS